MFIVKSNKEKIKKLLSEGGVEEVIGRKELEKKLSLGKKLIVKFGADPTRPDLHLGHAVALRKMREFQDLGHKVVFLIGDATSKVGDPTGQDKTRPMMSDAQIKKNAATYVKQASKILKTDKNLLEIKYNSQWFSRMSFYEFLRLMTMTTAARILERDMFQRRMKSGRDIGLHELVYPIMQGYDSVKLKADVVLLGSDQKFNELFGRHYQQKFGQDPQCMVIIKIMVGTDGKEKMSKSLDNYVGITESADQIYGKIMSIPDTAMKEYFELATDLDYRKARKSNPRDTKMRLAYEIVKIYHGEKEAKKAQDYFVKTVQKKELPDKIKSIKIASTRIKLTEFIVKARMATSIGDARRKIEQGGVSVDGEKIIDYKFELNKKDYNNKVIKVGKLHFSKIIFK
ncbi:MAG: tyrosine--tRNA ligase [Candidatus Moranbacteria bacterium CG_4_10_14_3_um_filter_44_15]|nr:MAG: tyrosine--tRNA ligase [Candidatus Moranbacteria bacterium CG06_land_8_20_14_3_00_43_56]PIV83643.1 MAG: tyrosine--tRNA ligase [Candidatus Moranbacteria bacterium CG17_big_fil_post_rev_8_21_14_2_50_44_12]PIW93018.1 MAG: tyrosine--tRNA ligase [Candidatus Moranbacteria bacterium CG_4_8_14_3_um_filter_43_15]PIX90572.1 MAG: tyrosine--tRNA ligase [Candidatus Moranbacteria bacterium CG_4_10_14_3_um_filter_44_15]PJA86402.1 MAG: tyrosine--tRNA ligase [Candidatus Moranbacteria bacterium CG_4_9_14_